MVNSITNRMLHWSYTPEQKEEVKKALAAGVPKATILTYFYPEVPMEKMSSYRKKQHWNNWCLMKNKQKDHGHIVQHTIENWEQYEEKVKEYEDVQN